MALYIPMARTDYRQITKEGGGALDQVLKFFTSEKYPGERHMPGGYNFLGPGTDLINRRQNPKNPNDYVPINKLDSYAKTHDLSYEQNIMQNKNNKQKFVDEKNKADREFIEGAKTQGVAGKISSLMIQGKMGLENTGLLDTKKFSGAGVKPKGKKKYPDHKLRLKAKKMDVIKTTKPNKKSGGFAVLIPILASLATEGISQLIQYFAKKSGSGVTLGTAKTKTEQINELLKLPTADVKKAISILGLS